MTSTILSDITKTFVDFLGGIDSSITQNDGKNIYCWIILFEYLIDLIGATPSILYYDIMLAIFIIIQISSIMVVSLYHQAVKQIRLPLQRRD